MDCISQKKLCSGHRRRLSYVQTSDDHDTDDDNYNYSNDKSSQISKSSPGSHRPVKRRKLLANKHKLTLKYVFY